MVDLELDELKREFLAEAEEKVREIASRLEGERTAETLDRLAYLAHQLKGSGGSYGYQRISTDAAEIEQAVEDLAAGKTEVTATIAQHVTALRDEITKRLAELGAQR